MIKYGWYPYKKRGNAETQTQTESVSCECGDRDWSDVSINQGMPRIIGNTRSWKDMGQFSTRTFKKSMA